MWVPEASFLLSRRNRSVDGRSKNRCKSRCNIIMAGQNYKSLNTLSRMKQKKTKEYVNHHAPGQTIFTVQCDYSRINYFMHNWPLRWFCVRQTFLKDCWNTREILIWDKTLWILTKCTEISLESEQKKIKNNASLVVFKFVNPLPSSPPLIMFTSYKTGSYHLSKSNHYCWVSCDLHF